MSDFKPKKIVPIKKFGLHKNSRGKTKVHTNLNKMEDGTVFFDIRQFYFSDVDGEYLPTKKGLSIHVDHLLALQAAVKKAVKKAKAKRWLKESE